MNERALAIHEAAHFVMSILGYQWDDNSIPSGSMPERISVIGNAECLGYVRNWGNLSLLNPERMPEHMKAWFCVGLLAGYGAEHAYGLSDQHDDGDVEDQLYIADLFPNSDFCKVMMLLTVAFADDEHPSEEALCIAFRLWKDTVAILENDVVRQAIEYVADELMQHREIDRPELYNLIEVVFDMPGVKEYRIPIPSIRRVTWLD